MSEATEVFDVVVVGAGPAGASAATLIAQKGRSVALVDAATFPRPSNCAGWLSAGAAEAIESLGAKLSDIQAKAFETVVFHSADLEKTATPVMKQSPGFLVRREALDALLVKTAKGAGASVFEGYQVEDLRLNEDTVMVAARDQAPIVGRLMVFAAGRGAPLLRKILLGGGGYVEGGWTVQVGGEDKSVKGAILRIVLGVDKSGGFAMAAGADGQVSVTLHTTAEPSDVTPGLVTVCRHLHQKGLIGVDLTRNAAATTPALSPTATALSMDTHVGKRSLVVGDAGGFVAAVSGEGVAPALWSAKIAVGVLLKALGASSPQDELMAFNAAWRTEMADYLRPPNTDIHYLLPLIFSNQPMADRMGAAFFFGENI